MIDSLDERLARLAPSVDATAGHALLVRRIRARRRPRQWIAGSLAVATGAAVVAALYALTLRDTSVEPINPASPGTEQVQTTMSSTSSGFVTIGTSSANTSTAALAAAGNAQQLAELWGRSGIDGSPPAVDFSTEVVLAITGPDDAGCPGTLVDMERSGPNTFTPVFARPEAQADPTLCTRKVFGHTYVFTGQRSTLGDRFTMRLPSTVVSGEISLDVIVDADGVTTSVPPTTSPENPTPLTSSVPTTVASLAAGFKAVAEQAITSGSGAGSTVACELPTATDVGTTFDCTRTDPDGSTSHLIATIDESGRVTVTDPEADNSTQSSS